MPGPDRRGERRLLPRYHPSCALPDRSGGAHLSVVASVGTTHLGLLVARGDVLRPAARRRVRGDAASPRLPPSLGRSRGCRPYSSPSSRGTVCWNPPARRSRHDYAIVRGRALIVPLSGGRQRVGRVRRASRPSGEREAASHPRCMARVMAQPPDVVSIVARGRRTLSLMSSRSSREREPDAPRVGWPLSCRTGDARPAGTGSEVRDREHGHENGYPCANARYLTCPPLDRGDDTRIAKICQADLTSEGVNRWEYGIWRGRQHLPSPPNPPLLCAQGEGGYHARLARGAGSLPGLRCLWRLSG